MTLMQKKSLMGYLFVMPFIIGFLTFFAYPFIHSFIFSINRIELIEGGYRLIPILFTNYNYALLTHPNFNRMLVESIQHMGTSIPSIVIFSLFAANILNQRFRGRFVARSIFFLPVILTSGIILSVERNDMLQNMASVMADNPEAGIGGGLAQMGLGFRVILMQSGLPPQLVLYILAAIDQIYRIITASGVQILVFLAGLQTISPSLYEASNIEGATGWDNFWKITFPMLSPLILVNILYSVIDNFTHPDNQTMRLIRETSFIRIDYGLSATFAWIYFIVIFIILTIIMWVVSKAVFYQE
jgi:ABC-type sugar transport system permease subunit